MVRAVGLIAFGLLLAGCGSSDQQSAESSECPPLAGGATTPRNSDSEPRDTRYLTQVGIEALKCSDRVIFSFREAAPGPGYNISYEPAATAKREDGSGNPIEVEGSAFLVVRLTPVMGAEIIGEQVQPTYTGPRRLTPTGTSFIRQVVKTGDFEAMVTWVIGLDEERPFSVALTSSELIVGLG